MPKSLPLERLGAAPISWGICEVPGWGAQLPRDRVLAEMSDLGFGRVELGAAGYLPDEPGPLHDLLAGHGLGLLGAFVPVVAHDPDQIDASWAAVRSAASLIAEAGGTYFITAPVMTWDWGPRAPVDQAGWATAYRFLDELEVMCADMGLVQAVHPHLGTLIERADDVQRVLDNTSAGFTLDTGHLMIGGYDPIDFATTYFDRVTHVHLKDVVMELALPVLHGEQTIMAGVQEGMFCVLGQGDVPIASVVDQLVARDFDGWYVIEQDAALVGDLPPAGDGPIVDVAASVSFLSTIGDAPAPPPS